ncbi:MAG TPA: hypothetical protein EYO39_10725 [Nitrospirales bacterium]|nr:hypothetical protein [Nitrospirales bacterium]
MSEKPTNMSRRELMKYVALGGIGAMSVAGTQLFGRADSATVTSTVAPNGDPIRIGMIDPITGPYSTSSMHDIHGATVAMDMANASGGLLGRPVELLPVDDTSNADAARQQAIMLIKEKRVDVLIGSFNGEAALAVSEIAEQEGKLFMVTCAYINELSGSACRPSTFIYMPTARAMSRAVAPHIVKAFGSSWFFINPNTMDGSSAYNAMNHALAELGGKEIGQAMTKFGETDFTSALQEAILAKPDAVILNVYGWDLVNALKTAKAMNVTANMGIGGMISGEQIGRPLGYAANQGIWGLTWDPKVPTKGSKTFIDGVVAKYSHTPTSRCYLGYAALTQTVNAIRRAGTTDVSALIKTLAGHSFDGLKEGPSFFREWDHQHVQDILVGKAFGKELGLGHYDILETIPGNAVAIRRDQTACKL